MKLLFFLGIGLLIQCSSNSGSTPSPPGPVAQTCLNTKTQGKCDFNKYSDGYCVWNGSCEVAQKCGDLTTLGLCDSNYYEVAFGNPCVWQLQNGPCIDPVGIVCLDKLNQTDCISAATCYWTQQSATAGICQKATECPSLTPSGAANCNNSNLGTGNYCFWDATGAGSCQTVGSTTPCTSIPTQDDCQQHQYKKTAGGTDYCYWDVSAPTPSCKAITQCSDITTQTTGVNAKNDCNYVKTTLGCGWDDTAKTCNFACSNITGPDAQSTCGGFSDQCGWDNVLDQCLGKGTTCGQITTQNPCVGSALGCGWDGTQSKCYVDCSKQTSSAACISDPTCQWNGSSCSSFCTETKTCSSFNQATCQATAGCIWTSPFQCGSETTQSGCQSKGVDCQWNTGPACNTRTSQGNCTAGGCTWQPACSTLDPGPQCSQVGGCQVVDCTGGQTVACTSQQINQGCHTESRGPVNICVGPSGTDSCYGTPSPLCTGGTPTDGTCTDTDSDKGSCSGSPSQSCGDALNKSQCASSPYGSYCSWTGGL